MRFQDIIFLSCLFPHVRYSDSHKILSSATRHTTFRFFSPLIEDGFFEKTHSESETKPLLLYLPGFDGTALCPFLQLPELSTSFDVRSLEVSTADRSSFDALGDAVLDSLRTEETNNGTYLIGESFGALLAIETIVRMQEAGEGSKIRGLVLINPATSFATSTLARKMPGISRLPRLLYPLGLTSLLPLFLDDHQLPQMARIVFGDALPSVIDTPAREAYMGRCATAPIASLK